MSFKSNLNDAFKELFITSALTEKEYAKFYLIERYKDKVSYKLLKEQNELRIKGERDLKLTLIYDSNPFLRGIKN